MTYGELRDALATQPKVECAPAPTARAYVVGGMGGSALPPEAARFLDPTFPVRVHRDYDLPEVLPSDALYVAISYSGNTAETLSFAHAARERGLPLAVITSGGALARFAEEHTLPCVLVPSGMQPRSALIFQLRALLVLADREDLLTALAGVTFEEAAAESAAATLSEQLRDTLPHFYASRANTFLAWVAKIVTNEGVKMPAYANAFSELNHNEMQSFDTMAPEAIASTARFVLLRDPGDDVRITRRMDVFTEVMQSRNRVVHELVLWGEGRATQLVRTWYVLHRYERLLAAAREVDPDRVPLIEDFKKRL